MKKSQKILCLLLIGTFLILPALVSLAVNDDTSSPPLKVEIATDKDSYSTFNTANFTVKITNISNRPISDISAEVALSNLVAVGKNSQIKKEISWLNPGGSLEFSYSAMLSANSPLNFFQKIILMLIQLFKSVLKNPVSGVEDGRPFLEESKTVKFGEYETETTVELRYNVPPAPENLFGNGEYAHSEQDEGISLLSYQKDPTDGYFYTEINAWQRSLGFSSLYDTMAPVTIMFYDTVRVKFTYGELDWMIQMWKGQYGFQFLGAEIGVYHKPEGGTNGENIEHYDCATDENMLGMEMRLYNHGVVMFRRPYKQYWWVTGFVSGKLDKLRIGAR